MAEALELKLTLTDEISEKLQKVTDALSEERIRAIVREELADWEKRLAQRVHTGMPMGAETK